MVYYELESDVYTDEELYEMLLEGISDGWIGALFTVACNYHIGRGVPENAKLAAYFALKAVNADKLGAYFVLGDLFYHGSFLPKNYAFAKYCFEEFRNKWDSEADLSGYDKEDEYQTALPVEPIYPTFNDDDPDCLTALTDSISLKRNFSFRRCAPSASPTSSASPCLSFREDGSARTE